MQDVLRERLTNFYLSMIPLITINILWFFASLPIVTLIPATGALFYATNKLVHGNGADWRTFVEGFRVCFRRSWVWGLLNVVVAVLAVSNFLYYTREQQSPWLPAVVIVLSVLWIMLQVYTFPLLLEQEQPSLRTAFRNAAIVVIKRPFPALGAALSIIVLAVASTVVLVPAWIFITAGLCAYIANGSTLSAIEKITGKQRLGSEIDA